MKVQKYLNSLLPNFEKSRVREDITLIREELKGVVLPVYESAAKAMKRRRFKNKDVEKFDKDFQRDVDVRIRGNFVVVINEILKNSLENLDIVEKMVDDYYANDVMRDAMTYLKINLLQYIEGLSFALRYSRQILLWTYAAEVAAEDPDAEEPGDEMTKGEMEWLTKNRSTFFQVLTVLAGDKKYLEESFKNIPDVIATGENADVIPRTVGITRVDPFKFGLIPVILNPIYHVRMAIAEWQVARAQAAQQEKRMLEFRLLQLQQAEKGERNAKLEEQIDYTRGRLEKLNYKLKEMEEAYG